MGFVRYEQFDVNVVCNGANDVYANNFTAADNLPLTPVRALGFNGAIATTATAPIDGSFSITFVPAGEEIPDTLGAKCKPGDGVRRGLVLLKAPQQNFADSKLSASLNAVNIFTQGCATSFSLSLEPNNIITATLDGNFYDEEGMNPVAGSIAGAAMKDVIAKGGTAVAHAAESSPAAGLAGFSSKPFNATYTATRGLTPIYTIGQLKAEFVMVTDPQESISMQGDNIPTPLYKSDTAQPLCVEALEIKFGVNDVCGGEIYNESNVSVCGFPQTRSIGLATDDVLRGDITVVDYNYNQEI